MGTRTAASALFGGFALLCAGPALAVEPGDAVFSELLVKARGATEWIELHNPTGGTVDLEGCVLEEGEDESTLGPLVIAAGEYAVLSSGDVCVTFDDDGDCSRPQDGSYGSISLNDSAEETLRLLCDSTEIDAVTYDWRDLDGDCTGVTDGICSASLDPGSESAAGNDNWPDAWCVTPPDVFVFDELGREQLATPGGPGICPEPGEVCQPGDIVFSEIMADPPSSTREWFEMVVLSDEGCDLHGCELREGPFPEVTADNVSDIGPEGWALHTIDAPGNTLPLEAGEYALFSRSVDTVVGQDGDDGAVYSVYTYADVTFSNSEAAWILLRCDGVTLDSAPYNWEAFASGCSNDAACSVNLVEANEDAAVNDSLTSWCLPPDAPTYPASDDNRLPFTGTPGAPGECLQLAWPAAGEVLFSELMVSPVPSSGDGSKPDWFELANRTDRELALSGCTLRRYRLDEAGERSQVEEFVLGGAGPPPRVEPGAAQVFSKSRCLDGEEPVGDACTWNEQLHYVYDSVDFTKSNAEYLELLCPDASGGQYLVDAAAYDLTSTGGRDGHSLEFDPASEDAATRNDLAIEWCEASFQDAIPGLATADGDANYGTPGVAGECKTGQVILPPSGPGCRCSGVASGAGQADGAGAEPADEFGVLALLLLLILPARRRRR